MDSYGEALPSFDNDPEERSDDLEVDMSSIENNEKQIIEVTEEKRESLIS